MSTAGGTRQISKDGHLVLNGDAYLLPWSQSAETKRYRWNAASASTTWTLPTSWGSRASVKPYQLTDTGKHTQAGRWRAALRAFGRRHQAAADTRPVAARAAPTRRQARYDAVWPMDSPRPLVAGDAGYLRCCT